LGTWDYDGRVIFDELQVWMDPVRRSGPEAMAVDEWLLATVESPVLRIYDWLGDWGSVGYFGDLEAARATFSGVDWVRRWTGGGTVDHRADWTYSVITPERETLAGMRGAESYRAIHAALAEALQAEGMDARLSTGAEETGSAACFENPVNHDIIDAAGRKIAGAGQRRTKRGLLHQGSLARMADPVLSRQRAESLASVMAGQWDFREFHPLEEFIAERVAARYGLPAWTERRTLGPQGGAIAESP
jgi:lipoate-protein ligase A